MTNIGLHFETDYYKIDYIYFIKGYTPLHLAPFKGKRSSNALLANTAFEAKYDLCFGNYCN